MTAPSPVERARAALLRRGTLLRLDPWMAELLHTVTHGGLLLGDDVYHLTKRELLPAAAAWDAWRQSHLDDADGLAAARAIYGIDSEITTWLQLSGREPSAELQEWLAALILELLPAHTRPWWVGVLRRFDRWSLVGDPAVSSSAAAAWWTARQAATPD